jgi:8-oxo-dGTP pyrophosphatase MutT (NUDIX family)
MTEPDGTRVIAPAKDAATVILLRPRTGGGFEVFMVKRNRAIAFMGGAHVFPGGKVDVADAEARLLSRVTGMAIDDTPRALHEPALTGNAAASFFVCAIRETFEESGILLARHGHAHGSAAPRAASAKPTFTDHIEQLDATLDLSRLVPWARWITPAIEARRYDARFFLAEAREGDEGGHDDDETVEHAWWTPAEALDRFAREDIALAPPTLRNLELLSDFATLDAAFAAARSKPPPTVQPHFLMDGETAVLTLPGDPEHPKQTRVLPGPTRFALRNGRWWAA